MRELLIIPELRLLAFRPDIPDPLPYIFVNDTGLKTFRVPIFEVTENSVEIFEVPETLSPPVMLSSV